MFSQICPSIFKCADKDVVRGSGVVSSTDNVDSSTVLQYRQ